MGRPKAVRVVGTIDEKRIVYIEDYVLQYLTVCEEEEERNAETVLYGKREMSGEAVIYMIYGISRQMGQDCMEKERKEQMFHRKYRRLGYLHRETGAIILDDWGAEETLKGYYIFYDAEEQMKECLGEYYKRRLAMKKQDSSSKSSCQTDPAHGETVQMKGSTAELVALSNMDERQGKSPFLWIRTVVICIFIVFCAIAVLTVNSFDKLNDFIQTAVLTEEIIDADESD